MVVVAVVVFQVVIWAVMEVTIAVVVAAAVVMQQDDNDGNDDMLKFVSGMWAMLDGMPPKALMWVTLLITQFDCILYL